MHLRTYTPADCAALIELFRNTVHTSNARDYTDRQLAAWAPAVVDAADWNRSFLRHHTLVAEARGCIAGFGDIDEDGYLDRLYVHRAQQRRGIATLLCDALEKLSARRITVHASITAMPFFAGRGYQKIRWQEVERNGIFLSNCIMEKTIPERF